MPSRSFTEQQLPSRRTFLGRVGAAGIMGLAAPVAAQSLKKQQKRVLLVFQHGGLSQLESWDPKPGTDTGGPFRAISTSQAGTQVSELMPHTSRQMHHLSLLRGVKTGDSNHDTARVTMLTGWRQGMFGGEYPSMGAVCTHLLGDERPQPSFVVLAQRDQWHLKPLLDSSYLGPASAPVVSFDELPPDNSVPPEVLTPARSARRRGIRERLNLRFSRGRVSARIAAYESSFARARQLVAKRQLFDVGEASEKDRERYGPHAFGRRCLIARKLLEADTTFVKLNHGNYDTHFENFNHHLHRLDEFDRPFAALIEDLADRGLLESTLVIVTGEFGRTPKLNSSIGRDHWSAAWSIAIGGCGIKPGVIHGATNANGTEVIKGQAKFGHLFQTFYSALGIDPHLELLNGDQPLKIAEEGGEPIREVLA